MCTGLICWPLQSSRLIFLNQNCIWFLGLLCMCRVWWLPPLDGIYGKAADPLSLGFLGEAQFCCSLSPWGWNFRICYWLEPWMVSELQLSINRSCSAGRNQEWRKVKTGSNTVHSWLEYIPDEGRGSLDSSLLTVSETAKLSLPSPPHTPLTQREESSFPARPENKFPLTMGGRCSSLVKQWELH